MTKRKTAGILRRLGAILYDALIVVALLMLATALLIPFMQHDAISPHNLLYKVYLLVIAFAYFALSWLKASQTIGMRAWRMKIVSETDEKIEFEQALLRFCYAIPAFLCFGAGFLWMLFDKRKRCWHDSWSKTRLVLTQSNQTGQKGEEN